ncbi:signal peptidase 12 kDa subunit, partial [Pelagophyceae sp. CCMP2097]
DYKGQQLAEMLYMTIIVIIGCMAWVYVYPRRSFKLTFYGWAFGLVFCMILCVPDWPIFNRNPVNWLKEIP